MDRWACVNVVALPLQILLGRHPEWREAPAAVIEADAPRSPVLWVNRAARTQRIAPGMRYGEALSLVPGLRAGVVAPAELEAEVRALVAFLDRYSPRVEPWRERPGVFVLDVSGLGGLYPSLEGWGERVRGALRDELDRHATVVVGFSRFGALAAALAWRRSGVFQTPEQEAARVREVPLRTLLGGDTRLLALLEKLGLETVEDFLALPESGVERRLGARAATLHRMARGVHEEPLQPLRLEAPARAERALDDAETDSTRLMFLVKQLVAPLAARLAARQEKIVALHLVFVLERDAPVEDVVRPAEPTLDEVLLLELVRLRLEALVFPSGVVELRVGAQGLRAGFEQLGLFVAADAPRRDLPSAERALARLRAEFGEQAVGRLHLHDAHLPEAQARWTPLERLATPAPQALELRPLMRRLHLVPTRLPGAPGRGEALAGPFVISGGWWVREVHREYHFIEDRAGRMHWIFFDRKRERWFVHADIQ